MLNGGYERGVTEAEFPDDAAVTEFRNYLRGETQGLPARLADYYRNERVGPGLRQGKQ